MTTTRFELFGFVAALVMLAASSPDASAQEPPAAPQPPAGADRSVNPDFDAAIDRFKRGERTKIIGGVAATPGAFPWQVSLGVSWLPDPGTAHFCGGAIYNERWIVTAAHCLYNTQADYVSVVAGETLLKPGVTRLKIARLLIHQAYDRTTENSDIGLVELAEPLTLGGAIKPIDFLPAAEEDAVLVKNRLLEVAGWGALTVGGATVTQLQQLVVPFVDRKTCNDFLSYDGRVTENMICAGRSAGSQDACRGDSGGPLVSRDEAGGAVAVGLVSWGDGCGRPGLYGVYTRGPRFTDWLRTCVASPDECK